AALLALFRLGEHWLPAKIAIFLHAIVLATCLRDARLVNASLYKQDEPASPRGTACPAYRTLKLRLHCSRFGVALWDFGAGSRPMGRLRDLLEHERDFLLADQAVAAGRARNVGLGDDTNAASAGVDDWNAPDLGLHHDALDVAQVVVGGAHPRTRRHQVTES